MESGPTFVARFQREAAIGSDLNHPGVMKGKTPFRGPNPIPPRKLDPGISLALQEVIYRALRGDHAGRYATAGAFARDLEHPDEIEVADRPNRANGTGGNGR